MYYLAFKGRCHSFNILGAKEGAESAFPIPKSQRAQGARYG